MLGASQGSGGRQARPDAFVETSQDHEIGLLQPRLDQSQYLHARMPALRRTHRRRAEDLGEHGGEARRIGERGAMDGGGLGVRRHCAAA